MEQHQCHAGVPAGYAAGPGRGGLGGDGRLHRGRTHRKPDEHELQAGDQDGGSTARAGHGRGQSPLRAVADCQAWADWDPPPTDADAGAAEHLDNPVWLEMVGNRHGRSVRCRRKRTMPQVLQSSVTDLQAAARMPKKGREAPW